MTTPTRADRTKKKRRQQKRRLALWFWINGSLAAAVGIVIVLGFYLDAWHLPAASSIASDSFSGPGITKEENASQLAPAANSNEEKGDTSKKAASTKAVTEGSKEKSSEEATVSLTFVGDMMHAGKVADVVNRHGHDYPYRDAAERFKQDDLTIGNVETPITTRGTPAKNKSFVYKSAPQMAQALSEAGMDVVNLANNHILDQGEQGLLDTFQYLNQANIAYVGAGKNEERAYQPVIVTRNGIRIAVLGFSRVIPEVSWYAGKSKSGVAATYDAAKAVAAIKQAASKADLVIVVAHWGVEKVDKPVAYQRQLAKAYIDAGADLIIGGHPHVLQGFEQYKNKWIVYSLGNFVFTRATEPKSWETMMLQAECSAKGACELQMKPYYTELGRAVPLTGAKGQALIKRVEDISYHTRITDEGFIRPKP